MRHNLKTSVVTALVLIAASEAMVQPAMAQTDVSPAAGEGGGLEDIIVTARKRTESLQEVPAAVSAITQLQIQRSDLSNLESISTKVPQLVIGRAFSGSGAQLVLRGIGSSFTSIGLEQSVATIVDGVYYGQGRIINEAFLDLERIEVIKGPQALFYGKNATAGVVSLTTADPTSTPILTARAGYEFGDHQMIGELVGSAPLSDTLGIRIAIRATDAGGGLFTNVSSATTYTSTDLRTRLVTPHVAPAANRTPGSDSVVGRLTLKWTPDDRLTVNLKASGTRQNADNPATNYVPFFCPQGTAQNNRNLRCGPSFNITYHDLPADIAATRPKGRNGNLYGEYKSEQMTANVSYELSSVTFSSITNYQRMRQDYLADVAYTGNLTAPLYAIATPRWKAGSQELRALTNFDGGLNFMVGAYYQKTKLNYSEDVIVNAVSLPEDSLAAPANRYLARSKLSNTRGETLSGYGQLIFKGLPGWEMTAGVRYTHETKDSSFQQPYVPANAIANFPQGVPLIANQTFTNWSPETTVRWKPADGINIYAAYKTGFKAGGFSNSTIQTRTTTIGQITFGNETAKGFEAGVKTELADRQLRLNLTGFSYKFSGLQVDYFNAAAFAFVTNNVGSARTDGVELEGEFAPRAVPGLQFRGSVNYNHARYSKFIGPCFTGQTPAQGCNIVPAGGGLFQDQSGKSLLDAPRWTTTLGVSFDHQFANDFTLALSSDIRHVSRYNVSTTSNPNAIQKSYTDIGADIAIRSPGDVWELALIGRNLTNKFVVTGSFESGFTGARTGTATGLPSDLAGLVAPPRTVQVRLTYKLGQ